MKVAIIGAKGQLGSDLVKVFGDDAIPFTHDDIDVTNYDSLKKIKSLKPDVIINTAAFHKTDDCEDNPEKTFAVNAIGARNITKLCNEINATNVYISTDYVFDGSKLNQYGPSPYCEDDIPNPINTYGISKVAGELYTRLTNTCYIIRIASLFGTAGASGKGGNFVETMIKKAKNNEDIKVVDDMIMSPTYTIDVASTIRNILVKSLPSGVYHVANKGQCSWYEFAKTIFELLGTKVDITPIKTVILQSKAKRPMFSPLTSINLQRYGLEMENWEDALEHYLIEKGYINES